MGAGTGLRLVGVKAASVKGIGCAPFHAQFNPAPKPSRNACVKAKARGVYASPRKSLVLRQP